MLRIVATYNIFNQTYDEPCYVHSGLEWWAHGKYTFGQEDPPLAPIAIGMGPYLLGFPSEVRSVERKVDHNAFRLGPRNLKELNEIRVRLGNDILYSNDKYF